ncbi:MAG: hypothetical protein LBC46_02260 [Treponema sp.]|jgi:hypothetical protein|nr:hypothetical protein [Treponema sp.]
MKRKKEAQVLKVVVYLKPFLFSFVPTIGFLFEERLKPCVKHKQFMICRALFRWAAEVCQRRCRLLD